MASILDACTSGVIGPPPPTTGRAVGVSSMRVPGIPYPLSRPDSPVSWAIFPNNQPVRSNRPPEKNATIQIFATGNSLSRKVVQGFCDRYGCKFSITYFNEMEEAYAKLQAGEVRFDVTFTTLDFIGKMLTLQLLQPLNHDYLPHLGSDVWSFFQNPFYDQGARYTVPFSVWVTGIAYRRALVPDETIRSTPNAWNIFWSDAARFRGKTGILDDYREAMSLGLIHDGLVADLNQTNRTAIDGATHSLEQLATASDLRLVPSARSPNVARLAIRQARSYDVQEISPQVFIGIEKNPPPPTADIGFWFPSDRRGPVGNDCMVIPRNAENPVLAHLFLDQMLTSANAITNFGETGYQPPQNHASVAHLAKTQSATGEPLVPPWLEDAVVRPSDLTIGSWELELPPDTNNLWLNDWNEFKAAL